jgi:hypothetical protein
VSHEISERLRNLAYSNGLSESSIVGVALTMFFARGDDAVLGSILKDLGASLRRRHDSSHFIGITYDLSPIERATTHNPMM